VTRLVPVIHGLNRTAGGKKDVGTRHKARHGEWESAGTSFVAPLPGG